MPVAQVRTVALGCPEPRAFAGFFRRLPGGEAAGEACAGRVGLRVDGAWRPAFPHAPGRVAPHRFRADPARRPYRLIRPDARDGS
ncbi:hypothetical protein [Streptomyces sp. NPDC101393]|uniref:hypothetical protein n=1 Tax=Streptomyces sp. NPDC101393 TaxID=3366141 RepID=UPI00380A7934